MLSFLILTNQSLGKKIDGQTTRSEAKAFSLKRPTILAELFAVAQSSSNLDLPPSLSNVIVHQKYAAGEFNLADIDDLRFR